MEKDWIWGEKLREEFEANVEKVYEKQKALSQKVVEAKEALIKEAEKTSLSDDFKKATEKMTSLMDEWKDSGNAGKKTDDELWERFNAARQKFYDRKHANWENRAVQFENAKKVKEDLIEKAKSLQDSEEWQKTSAKYKELMDAWKAAGNAGREFDDDLWNAFNEARQKFYAKRNEFYEKLHVEHAEKYAEKQALVKEAKSIAGLQEYTREQTAMMKELSNKWKSIGFCGKDKEDEIWNEFRGVMDEYFAGLKSASEKRRANWREHMSEIISRKEVQIANQKRQIKRLQDDMTGLVSEATVADLQDQVEDKEDFIKQLEQEIEDIEKKLAEQLIYSLFLGVYYMNFHECMKLFYPETTIILYNQKNEVVLEGQVKDIRKECEKYHNVEVTFVSGRADTTGLKIWLDM